MKHKLPQRCTLLVYMGVVAGLMPFQGAAQEQPQTLPEVVVRPAPGTASSTEKYQLPVTTESVTAEQMAETINVINTEDALKYLPSLILRKRNFGDQQAPLATRTSGLGQSARSLIYADGVLLSTLIGNNNSGASPRWALVSPEEIERIDVMYGPYSAAYPGNSMGAVVDIITRMPQKFEAGVKAVGAVQPYGIYGTRDTYESGQVSAILGNRTGNWSWWLSGNHLHSQTQPLTIVTALRPSAPSAAGTPVSGAFMDLNRLGQPIAVLGGGGLETKSQDTLKAKIAYDFSPEWRATYALGYFQNDANSKVETYLRDAAGQPVYSGGSLNIGGFNYNIPATAFSSTSGFYNLDQEHIAQSLSLKSNMQRNWDWEGVVSYMRFGIDTFRVPGTALPEASAGGPGTIVSMGGTEWYTADLKGLWRPSGPKGVHQVSFGAHYDHYRLVNTTFATPNWIAGPLGGPVTANSLGKTETSALWLQDAWQFAPQFKLTLGARQEYWRAYDGLNFTAAPASNVLQPNMTSTKFSPKASLAWQPDKDTRVAFSLGTAYRFPTVSELYQAVTVGGVVFTPNPNLRPERAYSGELAIERAIEKGRVRASLFQENLKDALISQNSTIPGTNVIGASVQNIDRIRSRGIELLADRNDVLIRGLELYATVTYVDSEIRSDPGFRNAAGVLTNVTGKNTPNIPKLKWTAVATYRYNQQLSGTVAARHSDRVWATIDNTDIYTHTYQGFDSYTVFDARVLYQLTKQWSAAFGVENLGNLKYFLFHPFPQRTFVAELKFAL